MFHVERWAEALRLKTQDWRKHFEIEIKRRERRANWRMGRDVPEAHKKHVVEFVFAERPGHGDEEGLAEERRAGVVVARLLVLLSQLHRNHHVLRVLHPVHRQLEAAAWKPRPRQRYFRAS